MEKQKIYFPNLNGLRSIAAFLVITHHIEQFKSFSSIENYWTTSPFIGIIGKLGVVLFFVLSGFLITYILLAEENSFKTISVRKFYIRRMIRILPLYILIILLAFGILPNIGLFTLPGFGKEVIYSNLFIKLFLYVILFPNLVLSLTGIVPYASHTWAIGTMEQYYLFLPVILKYFKKYRIGLMLLIIFFYLFFVKLLSTHYAAYIPFKIEIAAFWSRFNIDCIAIGGIFALLLFRKSPAIKFLLNNVLFYSTLVLMIFLIVKGVYIPYIHYEFYSVLFGIIIINFASNDRIGISLENKLTCYLGDISYGLYMYHPIGIVLAIAVAGAVNVYSNWLIYPLSFVITILLASLSWRYYESFFLKYKSRFSKVISGSRVKVNCTAYMKPSGNSSSLT